MNFIDLFAMYQKRRALIQREQDHNRRNSVRSQAFALIPRAAWTLPESDKRNIAALVLLRTLDLQVQVRRAARLHQTTAAVLLARSSLETAIVASYVMRVPEAVAQYDSGGGRDVFRLLAELVEQAEIDLSTPLTNEFGKLRIPPPGEMVREAMSQGAPDVLAQIYQRFYGPLSATIVHAAPLALLRHVHPRNNIIRKRPYQLWSRRSAVHTADAMVGFVALEIVGVGPESQVFADYFNGNWMAAWSPLLFVIRGLLLTHINVVHLIPMIVDVRRLRKKIHDGGRLEEKEIERALERLSRLVGIDMSEGVLGHLTEQFRVLLREATWRGPTTED